MNQYPRIVYRNSGNFVIFVAVQKKKKKKIRNLKMTYKKLKLKTMKITNTKKKS